MEARKTELGLQVMGLRWEPKESLLVGPDAGRGLPYGTKDHLGFTVLDPLASPGAAAVASGIESWTNRQLEQAVEIHVFKHVFQVADAHLRNVLVTPGGDLLSADEMSRKPTEAYGSFLEGLFVRKPVRQQFQAWVEAHGEPFKARLLLLWPDKLPGPAERKRLTALLCILK